MKKLQDHYEDYKNLAEKKNLKGKEALEAVKQNGYALGFVKEQTEEICLEAIKQDGYALQYVNEELFKNDNIKYCQYCGYCGNKLT